MLPFSSSIWKNPDAGKNDLRCLRQITITVLFVAGAFGYLVTGDTTNDITGNYGLQDQKQAIKWISENIQFFGGDANRVRVLVFKRPPRFS